MNGITTLLRRLAGAAAVVALAGALLAPGQAKAATISLSPFGAVTNSWNGAIWYVDATPVEQPHVDGWAADPNAGVLPITVTANVTWYRSTCWTVCSAHVVNQASASQTANLAESATAGSSFGPNHGFSFALPWYVGQYDREQVCVTAINVGSGSDTSLGCYDVEGYHLI